MRTRFFIVLLTLSVTFHGQAQDPVSQQLASVFDAPQLRGLREQLGYMNTNSFKSPPLREIDLRIRSNDLEPTPEDYRLRVGLLNPREQKANKQYHDKHTQFVDEKWSYELNQLLADRYKELIDDYFIAKRQAEAAAQYERLKVYSEATQQLSVRDIIELDEELFELELRQDDLQSSRNRFNQKSSLLMQDGNSVDWTQFGMVSIEQISLKIAAEMAAPYSEVVLADIRYQLDEEGVRLEHAESRGNFGYIQAEYDTDRGNEFDEHFGYQVGFNLPIFNTDKPKLQREQLKLIQSQFEVEEIRQTNQIIDQIRKERFDVSFQKYEKVTSKIAHFETMRQTETLDIASFVALNKYLVRLYDMQNEIMRDIMISYIEFLGQKGLLGQSPYINYLSSEFQFFLVSDQ